MPTYVLAINARRSRIAALASRRAAMVSADRIPCRHLARWQRSSPSAVRKSAGTDVLSDGEDVLGVIEEKRRSAKAA